MCLKHVMAFLELVPSTSSSCLESNVEVSQMMDLAMIKMCAMQKVNALINSNQRHMYVGMQVILDAIYLIHAMVRMENAL
jgi:hypothetical protein